MTRRCKEEVSTLSAFFVALTVVSFSAVAGAQTASDAESADLPTAETSAPADDTTTDAAPAESAPPDAQAEPAGEAGEAAKDAAPAESAPADLAPVEAAPADPAPAQAAPPSEKPPAQDPTADLFKAFAWAKKVKVAGFGVLWGRLTEPATEGDPLRTDFRLRFARVGIKAAPHEQVEARVLLAFDNANTLFDYTLTYKPLPFFQITAGQFLLPLGGQVATLAKDFVLMDRPTFAFKLSKKRFRDIGVMFHSGGGNAILNGLFNYELVVANSSGVGIVGPGDIANNLDELLLIGRAKVNLAPLITGNKDQLTLAATYAFTQDPAQNTGVPADDKKAAADRLGTSFTPFTKERATQVMGADLTVSMYDVWVQTELMYLHSAALDASAVNEAYGANLDIAYRVAAIATQFAGRVEMFDPSVAAATDEAYDVTAGVNFEPAPGLQLSSFVGATMTAAGMAAGDRPVFRLDTRMKAFF